MSVFIFFYIAAGVFLLFHVDARVENAPLSFYVITFPFIVLTGPLIVTFARKIKS